MPEVEVVNTFNQIFTKFKKHEDYIFCRFHAETHEDWCLYYKLFCEVSFTHANHNNVDYILKILKNHINMLNENEDELAIFKEYIEKVQRKVDEDIELFLQY